MRAITVIGTNVVIDCETVEEAVAYMDRLAATPAPLDERPPALPPANPSLMSSLDDEVVLWNPEPLEHFPMSSPHDTSDRRCSCGELLTCPAATPAPLPPLTCAPDCPRSHEADGSHYDVRLPTPAPLDAEQEAALMPLPSTLSERDAAQVRLNVAALLRAATPAPLLAKVESSDQATPAPPFSPIVITVCPHSVDTRFTHCLLCERAATPAPLDADRLARALTEVQGGALDSWMGRAPLIAAAYAEEPHGG